MPLPPVFAGLDPRDAEEASSLLQYVGLDAGEALMVQGEEDLTLAFITQGAVKLTVDDVPVGNVGARDMLGELELFGQMPRVASAIASGPVHLGVLAYEHYLQLCDRGNPAAFNLERHSIRRVSERLRWFDEGIVERSRGIMFEVHERPPGFFQRIFRGRAPNVDVAGVLAMSPLFDWAEASILHALAQDFQVRRFAPGHVLCQQGQVAEEMFIIASGRVDLVLVTGPSTAEMLATLGPGQSCGEASMAQHTPRSSSYVCREEVVALQLNRANFTALFASNDPVGSTFRQGIMRNLIALLLATQRRFVELEASRFGTAEQTLRGTPVNAVWRD